MFSMVTKTITVTEDAYETIKRMKRASESFSDLFLRIGTPKITARDLIGICKGSGLSERFWQERKLMREGAEKRLNDVRTRLERNN